MGAIIAYLNRNIPVVFAAFVIIVISYISAEISSLVAIPQLFFLIFFPRPMLVVCGLLICYIVFNNLLYICAKENYPIPLLNPKPSNRYAAFPVGRTSGRSMGSSAFIFASAASMIRICEAWRRSNSRRTEFSGMPSSFAEPDLGPAVPTHGLVDGKLRSHQRRENRPVGAGMSRPPPRQRPARLHVSFQRRNHAVARIRPRLFFGLAFGQCLRNFRKTNKPPSVGLPFHAVAVSKRHDLFEVRFCKPQLMEHCVEQAGANFLPPIL